MRLLLDTHIAIWATTWDARMGAAGWDRLQASPGQIWVSAASIWEIAIKYPLRRSAEPMPFSGADAMGHFRDAGFHLLDIRPEHTAAVEDLPPLHADPFDRLLLAQARSEPLLLLTHDPQLMAYGHGVIKV